MCFPCTSRWVNEFEHLSIPPQLLFPPCLFLPFHPNSPDNETWCNIVQRREVERRDSRPFPECNFLSSNCVSTPIVKWPQTVPLVSTENIYIYHLFGRVGDGWCVPYFGAITPPTFRKKKTKKHCFIGLSRCQTTSPTIHWFFISHGCDQKWC